MRSTRFRVAGIAKPQGSKNPWGGEANKGTKPWRGHVTQEAAKALEGVEGFPIMHAPLLIEVTFTFPRPKSHYRTGKNAHILRDDAPFWHTSTPDADKLQRAIGDALTGTAYRDDSQIACWTSRKHYADTAYCDIHIIELSGGSADEHNRDQGATPGQDSDRPSRSADPFVPDL